MNAATLKDAKLKLEELIEQVIADAEPTIVVTQSGDRVVMLPLDEYNSWKETVYLLSNPTTPSDLQEQAFVSAMITAGVEKSATILDSFSTWLLAGFAGGFALILSNLDKIEPLKREAVSAVTDLAYLLLWALVFGVAEKLVASLVLARCGSAAAGREAGKAAADAGIQLDLKQVFLLALKAAPGWTRWALRRSLQKARDGDRLALERGTVRLSQQIGRAHV